ncbi:MULTISPECIES: ComF family protein [unclassified Streptomyces]|uniref:ComF family protein n=1 Tax=unclassified Streptomyces TaxID=2593676 RepID=UPI001F037CD0|nr:MULTISPECIES: ComF family protein [unclassified Streptomyces]MCH0566916.1 ComF family protein [Streptomyces sp. MUM 2J]MCH0572518.1 ComF family protein [Streptomyces sp. MUM 136J]
MRGWWKDLTDLVLPAECGGCGRPRTALCPECRAALSGAVPRRVEPVPEPPGLPVVHAVARYEDQVRAMLLAHKERGALALGAPLGAALAGAVLAGPGAPAASGDTPVLLVPVPSARGAVRARGHDPVRRIALAASGELRRRGVSARVLGVLRQRRPVADQAGLDFQQRQRNLAGALAVVRGAGRLLAVGSVVLVDDVMTTGASLAEAARAVRAAGGGGPGRGPSGAGAGGAGEGAVSGVPERTGREGARGRRDGAAEGDALLSSVPTGGAAAGGAGGVLGAAVVAASPDAFEKCRN